MNGMSDELLLSPPFAAREGREEPRAVPWHHAAPFKASGRPSLFTCGTAVRLSCLHDDLVRLIRADQILRQE